MSTLNLDWSQSAHSYQTALALAKASRAAYCHDEYLPDKWAAEHNFKIERTFDEKRMYGFAATKADTIVFAFRGTDQGTDWLVNVDMEHKPVASIPGRVHDGFWKDGLGPLLAGLTETLQAGKYPRIWITGHSLGGAIAVLFQASLVFQQGRMVTGIYTFGQPRVGDGTFRDQLDDHSTGQYHRYINHNDLVPLVPPHLNGYRHGGSPVRFDRNGEPQFQDGIMFRIRGLFDHLEERLDSLVQRQDGESLNEMLKRIRQKPTEGVRDHAITEYIEAIEKVIGRAR
jgi:triacylglycerol lipase